MQNWAIILGSSSGFGAETCRELANRGINIYGIHLDRRSEMEKVALLIEELKNSGVEVRFNNMSATDPDKRKKVIHELKEMGNIRIKILLHSLAFGTLKPFLHDNIDDALQPRQIEMTLNVMANSLVYWTQDLFKEKLLKRGSQIFAMTSSGGRRQWKSYGAVSAAKASLESYCRQLALELSSCGIAVNSIQAGVTDTPALRKIPGNDIMIENALRTNPGGRLTLPQDVAKSISLIGCSEESWMTGNIIRIDGGEDITG